VLTREEIIGKIDSITVKDVLRAGINTIRSVPTVSSIGPVTKVMDPVQVSERLGTS
jgi:hypothetical protein